MLNVSRQYLVIKHHRLKFAFRRYFTEELQQSRGFKIYKGFSNSTTSRATLLYTNEAWSGHSFIINLNQPTCIRYLEINSTHKLAICEIEIYQQGMCSLGIIKRFCALRYVFQNFNVLSHTNRRSR